MDAKYICEVIGLLKVGFTLQIKSANFENWLPGHKYTFLKETEYMDLYLDNNNRIIHCSGWKYLKGRDIIFCGELINESDMCSWSFSIDHFKDDYAQHLLDGSELDGR